MIEESIKNFLRTVERIALALERIADQLEAGQGAAILGKPSRGGKSDDAGALPAGPPEPDDQVLRRFLSVRGLTLGPSVGTAPAEKVMQDLLKFIGDKYARTGKLFDRMRVTLANRSEFYFHLKGEEITAINDIIHVSKHLTELKLTSNHVYKSGPHFMLSAELPSDPGFLNFINRGWLEQYLHQEARKMLEKHRTGRKVISVLNGQLMEGENPGQALDVMFLVGGKELFWFQVVTNDGVDIGPAQAALARDVLQLDLHHAWVVGPDLSAEARQRLTALGFTAIPVTEFPSSFAALFAKNRG